jgi:hypothetical protein
VIAAPPADFGPSIPLAPIPANPRHPRASITTTTAIITMAAGLPLVGTATAAVSMVAAIREAPMAAVAGTDTDFVRRLLSTMLQARLGQVNVPLDAAEDFVADDTVVTQLDDGAAFDLQGFVGQEFVFR